MSARLSGRVPAAKIYHRKLGAEPYRMQVKREAPSLQDALSPE